MSSTARRRFLEPYPLPLPDGEREVSLSATVEKLMPWRNQLPSTTRSCIIPRSPFHRSEEEEDVPTDGVDDGVPDRNHRPLLRQPRSRQYRPPPRLQVRPEKCEALKRLLAQSFDVSNYFPQVVKNVASQSLEVKKLVYFYLLHYAEKRPNEALLSINSFQRDLGDPNSLVRAWAMGTMAGIRLHMIAPIVLVAVGKCARDPSVYVRKCAANALPKLHDLLLEELSSSVEEIVGMLLNDHSPGVVGAAASVFASIFPTNYSLIAKSYRRLCEVLSDVEEWGQISLIGILLRYAIARHGLVKESIMSTLHAEGSSDSETNCSNDATDTIGSYYSELASLVSRSYIEGPDEYLSRSVSSKEAMFKE